MKRLDQQKGFTLVELAIVMTIIGLLIGGILKGQALIQNARVTAQMAQVQAVEAATTTFNDTYAGLPGDLATATTRVPNCTAATNCDNGAGNGTVGTTVLVPTSPVQASPEAYFWTMLGNASLISGVAYDTNNGAYGFGNGLPIAKIQSTSGLIVNELQAADPTAAPAAGAPVYSGLYVTVMPLYDSGKPATALAGQEPMTPANAAQIDRKMDDGMPYTGDVLSYGVSDDCTGGGAPAGVYVESVVSKDCGLSWKIQN